MLVSFESLLFFNESNPVLGEPFLLLDESLVLFSETLLLGSEVLSVLLEQMPFPACRSVRSSILGVSLPLIRLLLAATNELSLEVADAPFALLDNGEELMG